MGLNLALLEKLSAALSQAGTLWKAAAGCAICAGLVVSLFDDMRESLVSYIFPPKSQFESCLTSYLDGGRHPEADPFTILVTVPQGDTQHQQFNLIDVSLRDRFGARKSSIVQVEAIDCLTLQPSSGKAWERLEKARKNALEVQERTMADVVIWGELKATKILRLEYLQAGTTVKSIYDANDFVLNPAFNDHTSGLIAAKALTQSGLIYNDWPVPLTDNQMKIALDVTEELVASMPPELDPDLRGAILFARATSLLQAVKKGILEESALNDAISFYELTLREWKQENLPLNWALTQVKLGAALESLGTEEFDIGRVEEAANAYREALRVYVPDGFPVSWELAQYSLINSLSFLAVHDYSSARLDHAVDAYRIALKDWTRDRPLLDWAAMPDKSFTPPDLSLANKPASEQIEEAVAAYRERLFQRIKNAVNDRRSEDEKHHRKSKSSIAADPPSERPNETHDILKDALRGLEEGEGDYAQLEQAVLVYQAVLAASSPETAPMEWAAAQNNLGNVLLTLGRRESGTARLEQAVLAFTEALKGRSQDTAALDWAATQNNLGAVLAALGQREAGTARLEQAVEAYRAALAERTRDRVPQLWAVTQMNLGNTLRILGEREAGTARLEEAVSVYRAVLTERTQNRVPLDWATTQMNLGAALVALGEREAGTGRLEQAVEAYRAALTEYTQERVPLQWAMTQVNLGNALLALGRREAGTERLEQAVAAYRAALTEYRQNRVPLDWAMTLGNEGVALLTLADLSGDLARARQALEQLTLAEATLRSGGHIPWAEIFASQIPEAQALVDRLSGGQP